MAEATFTPYTIGGTAAVLTSLGTPSAGLSPSAVAERLAKFGPNLVSGHATGPATILARQFRSAFVYLLLGAAAIAAWLGERTDAAFILAFVVLNAALGFYQEYHSERTLQLLGRYTVPRTRVRREGGIQTIESAKVVPGDLVELEPGDLVPADLRIIRAFNTTVDESVLTGESAPVAKRARPLGSPTSDLYAATNVVFAGTTLASGTATGVVVATGNRTVLGGIARAASVSHPTAFTRELSRFSRFTLQIIGVTLVLVFAANWFLKGSSTNLVELALFSVALAVSVIPEALPVVITFSLSRGALQLAKRHVVVKRLPAVEELGAIEVLCTDKTGTLTENRMTVVAVRASVEAEALRLAALAGADYTDRTKLTNPFDAAVWERLPIVVRNQLPKFRRRAELPFDPERRRNTVVAEGPAGAELVVRGAPEVILERSSNVPALERRRIAAWVAEQGTRGNRILAVASRRIRGTDADLARSERALTFAGLLAFADPIKPSTVPAVRRAKALGVKVKILTGDAPEVAGAVAFAIGISPSPRAVITGAELSALPVPEQHAAVDRYAVFARVAPEQKTAIIQLLQERSTVGFLGEGINDAPALKAADVALVVDGASDVAREAADIVLLKRSLSVIVDGIQQGRVVFANTAKYITATLASNFGNFYAVAFASLLIPFLPLLPVQILALNLLSDFPMIAIATDTVDPSELRKPRRYDLKGMLLIATTLGLVSTAFDVLMFAVFVRGGEANLQTFWFIGSVLTELVFLFSVRTWRFLLRATPPSRTVFTLTGIATVITLALPLTGFGRSLFHFLKPGLPQLGLVAGFVLAYLVSTEIAKLVYFRFLRSDPPSPIGGAGHGATPAATLPERSGISS